MDQVAIARKKAKGPHMMGEPSWRAHDLVDGVIRQALQRPGARLALGNCKAQLCAQILRLCIGKGAKRVLCIVKDDEQARQTQALCRFFVPDIQAAVIAPVDILPMERSEASVVSLARRQKTLLDILDTSRQKASIWIAEPKALIQPAPPAKALRESVLDLRQGAKVNRDALIAFLIQHGYQRQPLTRYHGDFSVRGGIIDIFSAHAENPVRVDFFAETIDSLRSFDPESQRSKEKCSNTRIAAAADIVLDETTIACFRRNFLRSIGSGLDNILYTTISRNERFAGMQHFMPLFYDTPASVFTHLSPDIIVTTPQAEAGRQAMYEDIRAVRARDGDALRDAFALAPSSLLYVDAQRWEEETKQASVLTLDPFVALGAEKTALGTEESPDLDAARAQGKSVFPEVKNYVRMQQEKGRHILFCAQGEGGLHRLHQALTDECAFSLARIDTGKAMDAPPATTSKSGSQEIYEAILPLERGFVFGSLCCITQGDMYGVRKSRPRPGRAKELRVFLGALYKGDLVVHIDHGIGRYIGIKTLTIDDKTHDCLHINYAGNDRLFLPVENMDLLTRHGPGDGEVKLDKLGALGWQTRKSAMKKRLRDIARELIELAAARARRNIPPYSKEMQAYTAFCDAFPYAETADQLGAARDIEEDLQKGRPMDRLLCGDVGFGKTEIAMRASFLAAMNGKQVAVLCPTTLLALQHTRTFEQRFAAFPLRIGHISRLSTPEERSQTKAGLASGRIDIVIGTHALLAPGLQFADLGLVIIDEEQQFGVVQKEKLKRFRTDSHVLSLSATPIPRTLHFSLAGIKDLSLLTTPPAGRLPVHCAIGTAHTEALRDVLLREKARGGQIYYVAPRIAHLPDLEKWLQKHVSELPYAVAHGRMAAKKLDSVMCDFYAGKFPLLLATTIVASGLDIPSVGTLIVHRADLLGLAQLYQLRGRIGRSARRGYAFFSIPTGRKIGEAALARLRVLQSLESLGSGFSLSMRDLEMRGAGNLLGQEQSGRIEEVGVELYRNMLENALRSLREDEESPPEETFSPEIALGVAVKIPESYIAGEHLRLSLYQQLAELRCSEAIGDFREELEDRFGKAPAEMDRLLAVILIKLQCRRCGVARLEAGARGFTLRFHKGHFARPEKLITLLQRYPQRYKLRADHRLVCYQSLANEDQRLKKALALLRALDALLQEDT